jgi:polysaccharide biosynthesis transport protein
MDNTTTLSADLHRYFNLFLRWLWLLILSALLCGLSAFFITRQLTPIYQSGALLLVNEAPSTKAVDLGVVQTNERLARTYVELMKTRPVLEGVIATLRLDLDWDELREQVTVQPLRDTQLIRVTVQDPNPLRAALIANVLVYEFKEAISANQAARFAASKTNLETELDRLEQQTQALSARVAELPRGPERDSQETTLAQYKQTYTSLVQSYEEVRLAEAQSTATVNLVEEAVPNRSPVYPRPLRNTALATLVGFMLAAGVAFLFEALDNTLKTPEDVIALLGLPVIGLIGEIYAPKDAASHVYVADHPRSPVAEAFRSLRTNLEFAAVDRPLRTLLVTSASPAEGKTTICVNLAAVMAHGDRRVILVDADLRRPNVHRFLKIPHAHGLTTLFRPPSPEQDSAPGHMLDRGHPPFRVLPSGKLPLNPAELLGSQRMTDLLQEWAADSDLVILDGPPFIVADPVLLSALVDGVLVVIEPGKTRIEAAQAMLEQLQRAGAHVIGVVLNPITRKSAGYYSGRYRYYAGYNYSKDYTPYLGHSGSPAARSFGLSGNNGHKPASIPEFHSVFAAVRKYFRK